MTMKPTEQPTDAERGNLTLALIILTVGIMLMIGLVVDGAGKIQAGERANQLASSAARVAANSLTGKAITTGSLELDGIAARNAAQNYLAAAGVNGTAFVVNNTVTVTVKDEYDTVFLSIIGIDTLTGQGTASARLING
ncbi:pilus assembly protein TadG-related protein [Clavibacter michiganensis]|uniref:pilus assembly protein TadG-related protein n=1 Tax=Clavibacter michiganensis TaxID=28447 RepID=UPI00292EA71E|nr:pilus assembly protein TadG-related protein [Clavibacter michiganensis]